MSQTSPAPRKRGRPPAEQSGRVRLRLLDCALDVFAARGYDGATVHDIASAAKVSDAALYAHFASKRNLYEELFHTAGPAAVEATIARLRPAAGDAPDRFIARFVDDVLDAWAERRSRRFFSLFVRQLTTKTHGGITLQPALASAVAALEDVFAMWRAEERIASRASDRQLAWELVTPLIYIRLLHLQAHATARDRAAATELAREHVRYFLGTLGFDAVDEAGTRGTRRSER